MGIYDEAKLYTVQGPPQPTSSAHFRDPSVKLPSTPSAWNLCSFAHAIFQASPEFPGRLFFLRLCILRIPKFAISRNMIYMEAPRLPDEQCLRSTRSFRRRLFGGSFGLRLLLGLTIIGRLTAVYEEAILSSPLLVVVFAQWIFERTYINKNLGPKGSNETWTCKMCRVSPVPSATELFIASRRKWEAASCN